MVDHPRSVIDRRYFILKCRLDLIYSFRYSAMFTFCVYSHRPLLMMMMMIMMMGHILQNDVTYPLTPKTGQKDPPCAEACRLSHKA